MKTKYNYIHFKKAEFLCNCGCGGQVQSPLIRKLDLAREIAGAPFVITSGFRCEDYNQQVGGVTDSAHLKGLAADIYADDSLKRFLIISGLLGAGFLRIGIYPNFIHADIDDTKSQERIWLE